jgi:hypothetical protein
LTGVVGEKHQQRLRHFLPQMAQMGTDKYSLADQIITQIDEVILLAVDLIVA